MPNNLVAAAAQAALRYGLDPGIFISLIEVESGFSEDVIYGRRLSSAGAGGISQFMTPTWQGVIDAHPELVRDYGARREPNGRFDPIPALYASAAHISDMLRAAGGDYRQALAGYYAGYGGRFSNAGRGYADLVLGRSSRGTPAQGAEPAAPLLPPDFMERVREAVAEAERETLGPLRAIAQRAAATGAPRAPTLLEDVAGTTGQATITDPRPASAVRPTVAGSTSVESLQGAERVEAIVRRTQRNLEERGLGELHPVRQAQLGSIVSGIGSGLRDVGSAVGEAVEPFARPVLDVLEAEQRFIGQPAARAVTEFTPLRFLPDRQRGITEDILSTILVPSTFMMPLVGRSVTVGSVLGRFGLRAMANPSRIREEYQASRIVLRALFPNQLRLAAQTEVAARFAAAEPGVAARRLSAERLQGQLGRIREELEALRPGATKEVRAFGRVIGTVDRDQLTKRADLLRTRIETIQQRALADTRLRLENIGATSDPAITDAINKTEAALRDVAKFNQPSRYSPFRLTAWRKHVTGYSDEMEQSLRWLIPDLNPPSSLTVSIEELATKEGFDLSRIDIRTALRSKPNLVSGEELAFGKTADPLGRGSKVFDFAGRVVGGEGEGLPTDSVIGRISDVLFEERVDLSELAKVFKPENPSAVPKWQQREIDLLESELRRRAFKGDNTAIDYFVQVHGADPDDILMAAAKQSAAAASTTAPTSKIATDPVVQRLAAQAEEETKKNVANWKASLEWIYNLGAEGAFDPKAHPGTVFNWAIRASEPLSHIPLVGQAAAAPLRGLGRIFQPLGALDEPVAAALVSGSRYRRAAAQAYMQRRSVLELAVQNKYGEGLIGKPVLKAAYKGPAAEARAQQALDRYLSFQGTRGVTFDEASQKDMLQRITKAFRESTGTVQDAFRNRALYELDDEGMSMFRFLDEALTSERDSAFEMGVSIGRINGDYLPQRRIVGEPLKLGTAGRVVYPRAFKSRTIEDFDDFVAAAAIDGQDVEHNITNLLDWRLGQSAEKKAFQVVMKMLDANEGTARFVERPLLSRVKGPVDTRSAEFRQAIVRGFKQDLDQVTAEGLADNVISQLPEKLPIREAESYLGRELRLRQAADFVEDADKATARKLEAFFRGGRTVDVDENFVGRSLEALRSMLLSMDLSPVAFVQGARVFAQDPVSYIRAIGSAAAWQTTQHGRRIWTIQNTPSLRFAVSKGLQLGNPLDISLQIERKSGESFAAWMGRRFSSGAIPPVDWLNREMMDTVGAAKLHVFNTTYSTLLMAQQNPEIWGLIKTLPMFRAITKGSNINELGTDELARAVASGLNNYIGPAEFGKITPEGRPSFVERMALLTPSWTRGNIGMILDAPKVGAKGVVARHLFMNQLALQAAMATKLSLALSGKMPSFDPTSSDFLAVQTPTFRFHLFPTMSAFRLPFRVLAGRPEKERTGEENIWLERGGELSRFFEGRMAQGPRIMADLLQGEDFLGRKIDAPEQFVMKELLPIIGQEIWESIDEGHIPPGEMAQRSSLEFLGAAVIPKTPFQLYREKVELLAAKPFDQVTVVERKRLEQEHPELQDLKARQKEYRARRGDVLDQFFNLADDTRSKANEQITEFLDKKLSQPGALAEYAKLSGDSLAFIGQQTEASITALFGGQEEFEAALKSRPTLALDEIARRYWSLDPDDFVDAEGNRWSLQQAFLDADPDSYRGALWDAYRETRDGLLTAAAAEFKVPEARARQYTLQDWPSVRWRDPRAADLEVRRVGAQRALDDIFAESPYRYFNGRPFTTAEVERVRELRVVIEQAVSPIRAMFQAGGQDLPPGGTQRAIGQLFARAESEADKDLLLWMMFWEKDNFRPFLRNPERDRLLTENPDAIKFYPERVRFLLSTRLLNTPLGQDPEVVRIIQASLAR